MDPAEVLAVEIKQFVGPGMKSLVPRVIGQTAGAMSSKGGGSRPSRRWDEASLLEEIRINCGDEEVRIAKRLLEWAMANALEVTWGRGALEGGFRTKLNGFDVFGIGAGSWGANVSHAFGHNNTKPPFDAESKRRELLAKFNTIPGINWGDEVATGNRWPHFPIAVLKQPNGCDQFIGVLGWLLDEIRASTRSQ